MSLITVNAMVPPTEEVWGPISDSLAIKTKYELDAFQKHAVVGIHQGAHVFVTAKTGSGKTFVGEYLIARCLAAGSRVFYTTPIKSLSNQKYSDLKKLFPDATVGILTGDIKMCPDAQIVVMTAEILRNLLYKRGTATESVGVTSAVSLEGVAGIVIDEAHYIQDTDRGHVWEETLVLSRGLGIQLVLLSATMPSATALGTWLAELHEKPVWLLSTTFRVVPLVHCVLGPDMGIRPILDTAGRWTDEYMAWLRARKGVADAAASHRQAVDGRRLGGYSAPPPSSKVRVESPVARLLKTVSWLEESKRMPALFFVFSRKGCENYASLVTGSLLDSSDAAAATHIIDFHLSRHRAILEKSPQYHAVRDLLRRGIAFHHSGLQPLLKEIVEILFTRGYVRVLFATETFSVGLNMPTKTVVFLELEKFSDAGKRLLRPDEYIQMAGRAGRRGLDTEGLVIYEPMGHPVDSGDLKGLLTGALTPLSSRMRFHYDFVLKNRSVASLDLAAKSYWALQQRQTRAALGKDLEDLRIRLEAAEAGLTPEQKVMASQKAELESIVTLSVNAKRKKAEAALRTWNSENQLPAAVVQRYSDLTALRYEHAELRGAVEEWDAKPLLRLDPVESCLAAWGLVNPDTGVITDLGAAATECNESHPILMSRLAASGRMSAIPANEIPAILAGFLNEGKEGDATLSDSGLSRPALDILYWLDDEARKCIKDEDRFGVISPVEFWNLSAVWVCVTARWMDGHGLTEIANEFGLFEGNIQRGLLRVSNILDEWKTVATLRRDLEMLEKLGAVRIARDELIVDSLYLRG